MKVLIVQVAKQALFNLVVNSTMWSFHDNVLSMVNPRNLVLFKLVITELDDIIWIGTSLLFLVINDLSKTLSSVAESILFADDTSIIISNINSDKLTRNMNLVMKQTINWFQSNLLSLNYNKTHLLQFQTKKQKEMNIQLMATNSLIVNINGTKFLGLIIDSTLSWGEHIIHLTPRLNKACHAVRTIKPFMSPNVLKTVYFSYFHSVMSYGVIFLGNSYIINNIFKIQKRIIRIITNKGNCDSCWNLFKQLQY